MRLYACIDKIELRFNVGEVCDYSSEQIKEINKICPFRLRETAGENVSFDREHPRIRLINLTSQPELNGKVGRYEKYLKNKKRHVITRRTALWTNGTSTRTVATTSSSSHR